MFLDLTRASSNSTGVSAEKAKLSMYDKLNRIFHITISPAEIVYTCNIKFTYMEIIRRNGENLIPNGTRFILFATIELLELAISSYQRKCNLLVSSSLSSNW